MQRLTLRSLALLLTGAFLAGLAGCAADQDEARQPVIGSSDFLGPTNVLFAGGMATETHHTDSSRSRLDLGGTWGFRLDPEDKGITEQWYRETLPLDGLATIAVPGVWDLANSEWFDQQAIGWYVRDVALSAGQISPLTRLRFEGVFREARVWVNGIEVGSFDLPYLPFQFDVTDLLREGDNRIAVRIDNRIGETTLPANDVLNPGKHGWFPYGGISRQVFLEGGLPLYVAQARIFAQPFGAFTADVHMQGNAPGGAFLTARIVDTLGQEVAIWNPQSLSGGSPRVRLSAVLDAPGLWTPEDPVTYRLELTVNLPDGNQEITAYEFAFKAFLAQNNAFTLNGREVFLRGINRHEDGPNGPVFDAGLMAADIGLIEGMNANFARPGHYPNDPRVLDAFDAAGLMVAQEIPAYKLSGTQMADATIVDRSLRALEIMILRDMNRPSIVMWSLHNEVHNWEQSAVSYTQQLHGLAKSLDPFRPTMTAALVFPFASDNDISSGIADVIGINPYFGWYISETGQAGPWAEFMRNRFPDNTLFASEYGAGALLGRSISGPVGEEDVTDHSYSEEFQVYFHERYLDQFEALPYVRGVMPWVLADFRMQWTPTTGMPHPVEQMNLKGLVSLDRQPKQAYSLYVERYRGYAER